MDYEKIRQHLETLCLTITPSDKFYRACVDGGLIDRTTLSKIKEHIKLQGQGVATFLMSLTPLGGVAITKLVEIIEKTENNINRTHLYTAREQLSEAWEKHHQQIIGILITIREREGNAIAKQQMAILTQKAREEVRVELSEISKSKERLESEKKFLMSECNRLKSELSCAQDELDECKKKFVHQMQEAIEANNNVVDSKVENGTTLPSADLQNKEKENRGNKSLHSPTESQSANQVQKVAKIHTCMDQMVQTDLCIQQLNEITLNKVRDDDIFHECNGTSEPGMSQERPQSTKSDPGRSLMHRSISLPSKLVSLPEQGPYVHLKNMGRHSRTRTHPSSSTLPPIVKEHEEKPDQSLMVFPKMGGTIALDEKSSVNIQPGAVKSKVQVTAKMCKRDPHLYQKLERGGLSDKLFLGNCFNIHTQPDVNIPCNISTRPPGPFNSLIVHRKTAQKRKAQPFPGIKSPNKKFAAASSEDNIADITDQVAWNEDEQGVHYQINGSGQYQEFWVILQEKEESLKKQEETIKTLQRRLANLRKLGICRCDVTLFLPQTMPNNFFCLIFTNEEIQRNCPRYIEYSANEYYINAGYQPSRAYLHHKDEITITSGASAEPLHVFNINMLELRAKGMDVRVGLGDGAIPDILDVVSSSQNRRKDICTIPISIAAKTDHGIHYQNCLKSNWRVLINNLDVSSVINHLYQENVVSEWQMNQVKSKPFKQEQNAELLKILMSVGEKGFHIFCQALNETKGSAWLADLLNGT